jgi:molecular chaperone HscC
MANHTDRRGWLLALIGIDWGTTNSLVAYWGADGPEIFKSVHGAALTPLGGGVDENDEILVGQIARERLITHPDRTAAFL